MSASLFKHGAAILKLAVELCRVFSVASLFQCLLFGCLWVLGSPGSVEFGGDLVASGFSAAGLGLLWFPWLPP